MPRVMAAAEDHRVKSCEHAWEKAVHGVAKKQGGLVQVLIMIPKCLRTEEFRMADFYNTL